MFILSKHRLLLKNEFWTTLIRVKIKKHCKIYSMDEVCTRQSGIGHLQNYEAVLQPKMNPTLIFKSSNKIYLNFILYVLLPNYLINVFNFMW